MKHELVDSKIIEQTQLDRSALLLKAYSGIQMNQFSSFDLVAGRKVVFGLLKQLDTAISLHGPLAKRAFVTSLGAFFTMNNSISIQEITQQINSLMVFGDIRPLSGTGVEYLHERIGHFWRILGWEELQDIGDNNTKLTTGSIDEIVRSSGNLIRTFDLLAERWSEHGIGPNLIYHFGERAVTRENTSGYSYVKIIGPHTQTVAIVCGEEEIIPTTEDRQFFGIQSNLLRRLLDRYPMEFAFSIYDYFLFTQGSGSRKINVAVIEEYKEDGQLRVKGIMNGKWAILRGGKEEEGFMQQLLAYSDSTSSIGDPERSNFIMYDFPVDESHLITMVHGRIAGALAEFPDAVSLISIDPNHGALKQRIIQFGKAKDKFRKGVPTGQQGKSIVSFLMKRLTEYQPVKVTQERFIQIANAISVYLVNRGVQFVNLEAAHIHADTTPTKRQIQGMVIGAFLSQSLENTGMSIRRTTMIDEDHVPNALDH